MAAKTPIYGQGNHFTFRSVGEEPVETERTPFDVAYEVARALSDGDVEKAETVFNAAKNEGVFDNTDIGCSFRTWNSPDAVKSSIVDSIRQAKLRKNQPSIQHDTTKKV
jgi:hypothetical protein